MAAAHSEAISHSIGQSIDPPDKLVLRGRKCPQTRSELRMQFSLHPTHIGPEHYPVRVYQMEPAAWFRWFSVSALRRETACNPDRMA
jgi:hypothetical protein